MSLHTTLDNSLKNVTTERVVKYRSEPTYYDGDGNLAAKVMYWTLTRESSMDYEYLGLTRDAAIAGSEQLRRNYTRKYLDWRARLEDVEGNYPEVYIQKAKILECQTQVTPQKAAGDAWKIVVQVRESDKAISTTEIDTTDEIEKFFQEAIAREDEEQQLPGKLIITKAEWESWNGQIVATYSQTIEGFAQQNLSADIWNATTSQWDAATNVTAGPTWIKFDANDNKKFRLNYNNGSKVSNEWQTMDPEKSKLEITNQTKLDIALITLPSQWYCTRETLKIFVKKIGTYLFPIRTDRWAGYYVCNGVKQSLKLISISESGTDNQGNKIYCFQTDGVDVSPNVQNSLSVFLSPNDETHYIVPNLYSWVDSPFIAIQVVSFYSHSQTADSIVRMVFTTDITDTIDATNLTVYARMRNSDGTWGNVLTIAPYSVVHPAGTSLWTVLFKIDLIGKHGILYPAVEFFSESYTVMSVNGQLTV